VLSQKDETRAIAETASATIAVANDALKGKDALKGEVKVDEKEAVVIAEVSVVLLVIS
jgi:hypothetical protein